MGSWLEKNIIGDKKDAQRSQIILSYCYFFNLKYIEYIEIP